MGRRISRFFHVGKQFKREFKRQLRMLIVFTLGFTIAFSWRQTTFDLSQSFVNFLLDLKNAAASTILTSIFITLVSILLIYLTAHWLKERPVSHY